MQLKIFLLILLSFNSSPVISVKFSLKNINEFLNIAYELITPTVKIYIPQNIKYFSLLEKQIHEKFSKHKKAESGFVDTYNSMEKTSAGIQLVVNNALQTLFSSIEGVILEEKTFREKKQKVFTVKFPKNYNKAVKKKINSVFDLDGLLAQMKIPLVFNDQQKSHILKIIKRMQDNIEKCRLNPKKRHLYTTQLFISGPPGTGKTQLVYLLSEITGLPVVILSSSQLILMGYESIRALQEILEEVKISGAILFIDEAELLLMNRDDLINLTEESYKQNIQQTSSRTEFSEILHRLLTVFLSITGNKKHNIFVSSNQPVAFDKALSRRFLEFIVLSLPDYVDRIAHNYFTMYHIEFSDISLKEAENLFLEYNNILKKNSTKTNKKSLAGLSGSDIKVIITYLTQVNQPKKINGVSYYTATKSQLMQSIRDRLELYTLFGYNVSLEGGTKLSLDLEELETEYDKKEKALEMKTLDENLKYAAGVKEELLKYLYANKKPIPYKVKINSKVVSHYVNAGKMMYLLDYNINSMLKINEKRTYNIVKTNIKKTINYSKTFESTNLRNNQNFHVVLAYKSGAIHNPIEIIEKQFFTESKTNKEVVIKNTLINTNYNRIVGYYNNGMMDVLENFTDKEYNKNILVNPADFVF